MKECNFLFETIKKPNPIVFLYCYLLSFLLAFVLNTVVIHQFGFFSILMNDPRLIEDGFELNLYAADFMEKYGNNFSTFKHDALHVTIAGFLNFIAVLETNAIFQKKSFKYEMINGGYWFVSLGLMGGFFCQFAQIIQPKIKP